MGKQTIADILQLTPAQEGERLAGLRRLARAILNAIKRVVAFLFGGIVGDLGRDIAAVKGVAGRAAIGAAYGVEGVARGLDAGYRMTHGTAKAVGSILGALVPRPPVGPADVAAAAAAQEDRRGQRSDDMRDRFAAALAPGAAAPAARAISQPTPSPTETVALVRESVGLMQRHDMTASDVISKLPYRVGKWLLTLDADGLARLAALPSGPLHRHVTGVEAAPGLTPVTTVSHDLLPTGDELARMLRLSARSAAQEKHEVAAMSRRPGSAPRPRMPTEPAFGAEAEALFAASPRPARSYCPPPLWSAAQKKACRSPRRAFPFLKS